MIESVIQNDSILLVEFMLCLLLQKNRSSLSEILEKDTHLSLPD